MEPDFSLPLLIVELPSLEPHFEDSDVNKERQRPSDEVEAGEQATLFFAPLWLFSFIAKSRVSFFPSSFSILRISKTLSPLPSETGTMLSSNTPQLPRLKPQHEFLLFLMSSNNGIMLKITSVHCVCRHNRIHPCSSHSRNYSISRISFVPSS